MKLSLSPLPLLLSAPFFLLGCPADSDAGSSDSEVADDGPSESEDTDTEEPQPTTTAPTPEDDGDGESSGGETDPPDDSGAITMGFLGDMGNDAVEECSVWDQDCPDGEKCMPWSNNGEPTWNATKCVPTTDEPDQPGDPCTVEGSGTSGVDSCAESSMCWDVDPTDNVGTCIAFCDGTENNAFCDNPSTTCSITNDGVLILCLPNCDPLLQECPDGQACYGILDGYVCAPDVSGEQGAYSDACEAINTCDPGLECMPPAGTPGCAGAMGCCTEFCDTSEPDASADCAGSGGGQVCLPAFEEGNAPPGYEDVGYCLIPEA